MKSIDTRCSRRFVVAPSVNAADLPFRQRLTPGTTAWRKSYRRHNVVEGVNAMLKGGFVNIQSSSGCSG